MHTHAFMHAFIYRYYVHLGRATSGPRARSGPRRPSVRPITQLGNDIAIRPAKPQPKNTGFMSEITCRVNVRTNGTFRSVSRIAMQITAIAKKREAHYPVRCTATFHPLTHRSVHSDTISTSQESILAMQQLRPKTIHSHFHQRLKPGSHRR